VTTRVKTVLWWCGNEAYRKATLLPPAPKSQKSSTLHTNLNLTLLPSALSPSTPPQLFPLIIFVGSSLLSFQFCPWYTFVCQLFFCIRLPWLLSTVVRKYSERNFFFSRFLARWECLRQHKISIYLRTVTTWPYASTEQLSKIQFLRHNYPASFSEYWTVNIRLH